MPNFGFRHSNRSQQQQLDSPQGPRPPSGHIQQAQPLAGPASASASAEDKEYGLRIQPHVYSDTHNNSELQYLPTPIDGPGGGSPYDVGDRAASAESHRYSNTLPHSQQFQRQQDFDLDPSDASNPQAPGIPGQLHRKNSASVSKNLDLPVEPPKKSKSRSFFSGFSSKSQKEQQKAQPQQHQHHSFSLGRSASKKQSSKPELRMQQNNSSAQATQGWHQSQGSSSGTLPSHSEQDKDDFDPYQIREDEVDQQQHYDPRQGLSVRVVDDSQPQQQQYQHFQDQQHLQSPSPYSPHQPQQPQQYQQFSQHSTPITPDQSTEYNSLQMPSQQQAQYQQQNLNLGVQPSSAYRQQNPEIVSQLSHESPLEQPDDRPPSAHSAQGYQHQYPSRKTSIAGQGSGPSQNLQHQGSMAPPQASGAQGHQGRRSTEMNKNLQPGDARGQPPAYNQGQFPTSQGQGQQPVNLQSPLPPIPGQPTSAGYRNSQLRSEFNTTTADGRATPPVDMAKPGENGEMTDMQKLMNKYKKVKGLYFDKVNQVESLQNTLANQRLSQSRTSLDDSEYLTRFQRLDSAIKEVSFAVRKDWSSLPPWLTPVVNPDAMKTGTKEMTAVGRAIITRWLADEIWGKCFHPGLEPPLRDDLKRIENQVRGYGPVPGTLEEQESQTSKIIQWRLTTMEGLQWKLNGQTAQQAKSNFIQMCVGNLTAHLLQHLSEAAAMNIQGNATSIVELAVGIASHLPLESRDIVITYPMPKDMVQPWMKVEQPLPPLEHYFSESSEDGNSNKSKEEEEKSDKGSKKLRSKSAKAKEPQGPTPEQIQEMERKKMEAKERIRFAGFVGVEVKGRQSLYQPPVWTIA